jgi:hypothetical protein
VIIGPLVEIEPPTICKGVNRYRTDTRYFGYSTGNDGKQYGEIMKAFLTNLIVLVIIGIVLFVLFPEIVRGILGLYDGLGILPIFILLIIVSALPKRKRRRRN